MNTNMDAEFSLDMAEKMLAELQDSLGGGAEWNEKENGMPTPSLTPAKNTPLKPMERPAQNDDLDLTPAFVKDREDEKNEGHDIPIRFTQPGVPGAQQAMKDIERCSIMIADKVNSGEDPITCGRGDIFARQKFFATTWKKRFAAVVDHAYFGPVLFLFKYDKKGHVIARTGQMIVLADSETRLADDVRGGDGAYRCQFVLKTARRKYVFSTSDALSREYWIDLLRSYS